MNYLLNDKEEYILNKNINELEFNTVYNILKDVDTMYKTQPEQIVAKLNIYLFLKYNLDIDVIVGFDKQTSCFGDFINNFNKLHSCERLIRNGVWNIALRIPISEFISSDLAQKYDLDYVTVNIPVSNFTEKNKTPVINIDAGCVVFRSVNNNIYEGIKQKLPENFNNIPAEPEERVDMYRRDNDKLLISARLFFVEANNANDVVNKVKLAIEKMIFYAQNVEDAMTNKANENSIDPNCVRYISKMMEVLNGHNERSIL